MKKAKILFLILFIPSLMFSQKLTLEDLTILCGKKTWNEVNSAISSKGWDYYNSQQGDYESYNTVSWAFERNYYDDKAKGWLELYTYEGLPSKIAYQVFNKKSFSIIENSLKSSGFKLINSDILDDFVTAEYANDKYTLSISYSKIESDDYYESASTSYSIIVTKKGSIYDPDNGKKFAYDEEFNVTKEYFLKNGEYHGEMIEYYPNGEKKALTYWLNGKLNGKELFYDEYGNLEVECTMKNDSLDGIYKFYKNGRLDFESFYINGSRNGIFKGYHSNGKVGLIENFKNDIREGESITYDENGLLIEKEYFRAGTKNGPFYIVGKNENGKPDFIVYGNSLNDETHGDLYIIDFNTKDTLQIQHYNFGKKVGHWKEFKNNSLYKEYHYSNDELNDKLTIYFTEGENKGEIISEKNFKNGKLNGISIKYFDKFEIETENNQSQELFLPVLEISTYENDLLNGPYSHEEFGSITFKGNYVNDLKTGLWFETEVGTFWDQNEHPLILKGNYILGERDGIWNGTINGKKFVDLSYKKDALNGTCQFYNVDGTLGVKSLYNNGSRKEIHFHENNELIQSYILIDDKYHIYQIEQAIYQDGSTRKTQYSVADQVNFSDAGFVKYFLDQTYATTENSLSNHLYKTGNFYYDTKDINVKGAFNKNKQNGLWTTEYKLQKVTKKEQFTDGMLTNESFTDFTGELYTGTLEIDNGYILTSIKIKKGLRNGPTIETDKKTEQQISKVKYKNGIKQE